MGRAKNQVKTKGKPTVGRGARAAAARVRVRGGPDRGMEARKQPRQQRSIQMVEAILVAAAEVFANLGYAHATTNKIAERAGVSVGSLYQYFPNKDSLLAGLLSRHHEDVHRVVSAALERLADHGTPLEDGLRQLLVELVALHRENPELTRALSATVLRESPAADAPHKGDDEAALAREVAGILAARPEVRGGDHMVMAAIMGQATGQLTRWLVHDAPPGLDPDLLIEETTQLLVRYLRR